MTDCLPTERDALRARLVTIAKSVVPLDFDVKGDETTFDEIGLESLELLTISTMIERELKISLQDVSPFDLTSLGKLFDVVVARLPKSSPYKSH